MVHKTKGIVLRTVKYGETSVIVTIMTELFGLQSYLINGVRSQSGKGGTKAGLFQPAAIFQDCRPTYRYIHTRPGRWRIRTPQTHSSTAHVQGLGSHRLVLLMRLQDRVTGFPPKWKSSRSAALTVHASMMSHIRKANNRQEDSFAFGTNVLSY